MHEYLEDPEALLQSADSLKGAARIFVDTEFESTRDRCELCLVQVSRGSLVYVIDVLRLQDLSPLGRVMDPSRAEWVVHAGRQDVALLTGALRVKAKPRVFDTQVAWALLGPESSVSLAYLEYRLLGRRPHKSRQADNWKRRPLDAEQIAYAAADVELLPALVSRLESSLAKEGKSELVYAASSDQLWPEPAAPGPLGLETFRNAWQLEGPSQAALLALVDWYNALDPASRRTGPEPRALLSLAARLPRTIQELRAVKGIPGRWGADWGDTLLRLISEASSRADPQRYVKLDPAAYRTFESYRFDAWLQTMRAEVCAELRVAPDFVLPGRLLSQVGQALRSGASADRATLQIQGWRGELLGEAIARYARCHPPPGVSGPR